MIPWENASTDEQLTWFTPESSTDAQVNLIMSLAICTAFSFAPPPCEFAFLKDQLDPSSQWSEAQRTVIEMAVHLGARLPKRVVSKHLPSRGNQLLFQTAVKRDDLAARLLASAIHAQAQHVDPKITASYVAWADCIKPLPVADIPAQLYQELGSFADPELAKLQVPEPCPAPVTTWLPRKVQPTPPPGFKPRVLADILTDKVIQLLEHWLLQQMLYLTDIEVNGSSATRTTNEPLALGLDMFRPEQEVSFGIFEGWTRASSNQLTLKLHCNRISTWSSCEKSYRAGQTRSFSASCYWVFDTRLTLTTKSCYYRT